MKRTEVQWHEWSTATACDFGHGVHFHDTRQRRGSDLVAFIAGYEWRHNPPAVVQGYHIKPNTVTTARVLAAMKLRIERLLADQELVGDGMISRRIHALFNA